MAIDAPLSWSTSVDAMLNVSWAMLKKMNPSYDILFAQPIEMRFNEMLEGTKAELSVKIFGNNYDVLETLAEQIKGILKHSRRRAGGIRDRRANVAASD